MRVLIAIPACNEEKSLPRVISEIKKEFKEGDILVVDDGSTDETAELAKKAGAFVLSLPFNLGIAGAREAGFLYALENGYDLVVQMDADGQHDPKYIRSLTEPVVKNEVDAVIGSRFLNSKFNHQTSRSRYLGISLLSFILTILTSKKITDPTSGFSAYNKRVIKFLALNYPSDYPEPEIPLLLNRGGFRFKEIPIEVRQRQAGKSSISYKHALYYLGKVLLGILITCIRKIRNPKREIRNNI